MRSRYIEARELDAIEREVGPEIRTIMEIGIRTGLRINDICTLKAEHLWRDEKGRGYIRRKAQKTGKEGRWLIPESIYKKIRQREGYLFPGTLPGTHINRTTVWRAIKKACNARGIDPYGKSPHSLRKCYAVKKRITEGLDAAQEGLQHDNRSLTRLYAYADKLVKADRDEPIRWADLETIVEYIVDRTKEILDKQARK